MKKIKERQARTGTKTNVGRSLSVILLFKFTYRDKEHHAQKKVKWDFPVFPKVGDCVSVDDIEDSFGELEYSDEDSKGAIGGNIFPFIDKQFLFNKGKSVIELYFGE